MSLCRNFGLRNKNFVTDGAVLALGLARHCAGRLYGCIDYFGVAVCGDIHSFRCVAAVTLAAASLFALFGAGCFSCDCPVAPIVAERIAVSRAANRAGSRCGTACRCPSMTLGRNLSLCDENFVADRAVLAFRPAFHCAGRLDRRVNDFRVSLGGNLGLCDKNFVTDGAVFAFRLAGLRAGRLDCCVDYFDMICAADCHAACTHFHFDFVQIIVENATALRI